MDDALYPLDSTTQRGSVRYVASNQLYVVFQVGWQILGSCMNLRQKVVENSYFIPHMEQPSHDMGTDKTASAGYKYSQQLTFQIIPTMAHPNVFPG